MLKQTLKYDFPKGNSDPFDENFEGNYFIYANAFSNLGKNLNEFTPDVLRENIPTGYKTIVICCRISILNHGLSEKAWEQNEKDKYFLTSNKTILLHRNDSNSFIETNVLYRPNSENLSLQSSLWENLEKCIEYAKKISTKNKCKIIVSKVIESISWH